jgi:hypothetical protein
MESVGGAIWHKRNNCPVRRKEEKDILVENCAKTYSYDRDVEREMAQARINSSVPYIYSSITLCRTIIYKPCGLKPHAVENPRSSTEPSSQHSSVSSALGSNTCWVWTSQSKEHNNQAYSPRGDGPTLMLAMQRYNTLSATRFVNASATTSADLQYSNLTCPNCTLSRVKWCWTSMCLDLELIDRGDNRAKAPWLSHHIRRGSRSPWPRSLKSVWSHKASQVARAATWYSASSVETDIILCPTNLRCVPILVVLVPMGL